MDHLLEFMNCLSCGPTYQNGSEWIFANDHVENVTNLVYSDASWLSLYGLQFANNLMAASGEAFALNAATAVVNLDLANNELVAGTFHFNSSAAMPSNSLITGNDFIGSVTIDNQYVASKLSVMNFIGNSINQNVTLQGGWKKLNFIGNAWGGTFTNTATGHVTTIPDGMAGRYSAVYSPASDPGSVSIAGFGAMSGITAAGRRLVGIGSSALYNVNNSAQDVVGVGYDAAYSNTSGVSNIAIGSNSLLSNADGYQNVAVGTSALQTTT